jgi:DNA-binding NtrC family response regulator
MQTRGGEVLLCDADSAVRDGMPKVLAKLDLYVTAVADPASARDLVTQKFFSVVMIDIDTPAPGGGTELIKFVRERSPATAVLVLAAKPSFDVATAALRAGATDVIAKAAKHVPYLKERVLKAALETQATVSRDRLIDEMAEVHEEFLKKLLEVTKNLADLEERSRGGSGSTPTPTPTHEVCNVLYVDDDTAACEALEALLKEKKGYHLRCAQLGGEGLDFAAQERFHVVLCKDALPDLPGPMVLRSIQGQSHETVAVLFSRPGTGGSARLLEGSREIPLLAHLESVQQMAAKLDDLWAAHKGREQERRYHAVFRQKHVNFLKRYAEVRRKYDLYKGRSG